MYIERMYDYDRNTDTYTHTQTFTLELEYDEGPRLCAALFCLGKKIGEFKLKTGHFDTDAGRAVIGVECRTARGKPEYWAIRK